VLEKDPETRTTLEARKIANTLVDFEFFRMMADDMDSLTNLCKKIDVVRLKTEQYVFHQGDPGNVFYVLYEGGISITISYGAEKANHGGDAGEGEKTLKLLLKGDTFGENALKSETGKRSANAKCTQDCFLLIIGCEDYLTIESEHEAFRREQKLSMLRRCPAFSEFSQDQLAQIVAKMGVKRYDAQTVITNRGDPSPDLCLIKRGMVKVLKSTPLSICEPRSSAAAPNSSTYLSGSARLNALQKPDKPADDESPGIWVIQRNWREIMEPKKANLTAVEQQELEDDRWDFTVGVLGSGQFFGELAVLDEAEYSPVTVVACTNVELYCISQKDIKKLGMHINHHLKQSLEESMVIHNPPAQKVAHFFRSKVNWEMKKDRILESCMSEKWIKGRNEATGKSAIDSGEVKLVPLRTQKLAIEDNQRKEAQGLKKKPPLSKQQMYSIRNLGAKKFQF
jgi:CRP-like cAMP-binding protein